MKPEVGKRYVMRNGEVTGPLQKSPQPYLYPFYDEVSHHTWNDHGSCFGLFPSSCDLSHEADTETPVKPVILTSAMRKSCPMDRGCVAYFPDALAYVAHVSYIGNQQHNQGQPMHWARDKSTDHGDCIVRHQSEAGKRDDDTLLHSGKVAWRSLAQLQLEIESAGGLANVLALESSNFPLPLILTNKPASA